MARLVENRVTLDQQKIAGPLPSFFNGHGMNETSRTCCVPESKTEPLCR